ncbi:MAG: DUF4382 domain-containing protein [Thaumarchaeota archaeon]|nr:DUF4382 domain-containing protein [Nitrososphaerota archaeon]
MSTKKNVVLSGIAALAIAVSLIAVSVLSGIPAYTGYSPVINTSASTTSAGTTPSSSITVASQGILSILITDPPNVPEGVTHVYVTYGNLAVHIAEAGNASGWTQVKSQGIIELMSTVNVSQTVASVDIASGKYNQIRFNVSFAQVTYDDKNYTAFVPSSMLTLPIIGGIQVNASQPSATIIDITPTVINIGSTSNPEFIIRPVAKAFPVPHGEVPNEAHREGHRMSLVGKGWWKHLQQQFTANLQITSASLTANSLSLAVKSTGNASAELKIVTISPLADALKEHGRKIPSALLGSEIFVLEESGTLVPLQKYLGSQDHGALKRGLFQGSGYNLTTGATATLSYNGEIVLGLGPKNPNSQTIVAGQQYLVTVVGQDALASVVVVAG